MNKKTYNEPFFEVNSFETLDSLMAQDTSYGEFDTENKDYYERVPA